MRCYPRSHARHVPSSPTNSTHFFFLLDAIGWNQFELCPNGRLRYANSARYKNAGMIKKEAFVSPGVLDQARRIIEESGIVEVDPSSWPQAPTASGSALTASKNSEGAACRRAPRAMDSCTESKKWL